jgi:hypothetical protein
VEEVMTIDGLHIIIEGLVCFEGNFLRKGFIIGVVEFVCGTDPKAETVKTATALTFAVCTYSSHEHLHCTLRSKRFPTMERQIKGVALRYKFSRMAKVVVYRYKWWNRLEWAVAQRRQYKGALQVVSASSSTEEEKCTARLVIQGERVQNEKAGIHLAFGDRRGIIGGGTIGGTVGGTTSSRAGRESPSLPETNHGKILSREGVQDAYVRVGSMAGPNESGGTSRNTVSATTAHNVTPTSGSVAGSAARYHKDILTYVQHLDARMQDTDAKIDRILTRMEVFTRTR